jgi:hypothetical protein
MESFVLDDIPLETRTELTCHGPRSGTLLSLARQVARIDETETDAERLFPFVPSEEDWIDI